MYKEDLAINGLQWLTYHETKQNQIIYRLSKAGDSSRRWPGGSLFNCYYTDVKERVLFLSLGCSTLPSIRTLYCWMLSKWVSSTIFKVWRDLGLNAGLPDHWWSRGDLGSITDRVIPKTLKIVLDTSLLNTQQYKIRIKGEVEQSRERSSALSYISV